MRFKKILVPLDFSESSRRALEVAQELAQGNDGELHLFHSFPCQPPAVAPYAPAVPVDYLSQLRAAAEEQLHDWREKHCASDLTVTEHVSQFAPSESIVELAKEVDADLIVMGTRGLSGMKHILLGSVAERVVRHAECPVLTVKAAG